MENTYSATAGMISYTMAEYYDYVLGLIPLTAVSVAGLLAFVGTSLSVAVPAGAGLTLPVIGHALFVRAPVPRPAQPQTAGSDATAVGTESHTPAD